MHDCAVVSLSDAAAGLRAERPCSGSIEEHLWVAPVHAERAPTDREPRRVLAECFGEPFTHSFGDPRACHCTPFRTRIDQ